ncbi:MAG: J domain-containing protein [Chitinophagales bacterium]|nr:J domain-containing protein [Bacteroidota bacterium]MCB9044331.1 J domain-containing protein [Chitinophagales bacterium]
MPFQRIWRILKAEINHIFEEKNTATTSQQQWEQQYKDTNYQQTHTSPQEERKAKAYAVLELPYGSSWEAVKKSFKRLMLQYHPDKFHNDAEKKDKARIVSQKIIEAYEYLKEEMNVESKK